MKSIATKVHVILLTVISALLLLQLSHVNNFDEQKSSRVLKLIDDMSQLDTQSEQVMLQIYSRSIFDFDQFTADVDRMQSVFDQISHELSDQGMFANELEALKHSVAVQQDGAGEFKSSFAILSNSLRYFPTLISQLKKERPDLSVLLTELNRDVFYWQLYPDDQQVYARILKVSEQLENYKLKQLLRHVQLILDYGPRVSDAMEKVIGCGAAENAHQLYENYNSYFAAQVQSNNRDQVLLIVFGVVLLLYMFLLLFFRQRDAHRLLESENRFRLLFDLIPDGVGVHQDGRWIYCNPALAKMFGAGSESELNGTSVLERVHPEMRDVVAERIERELSELEPAPMMLQQNLKMDYSEFFGEVQGIPFVENGQRRAMVIVRDVTEQLEADQELKKMQQHLLAAQSVAHIGSWELDLVNDRLWWSDEIFNIFEITKDEFDASYEAFLDKVHPDDRAMLNSAYNGHLEQGKPYDLVHRLLLADSSIKYVHERCETERDEAGKPLKSIGTVQEVSEQIKAEQEKLSQQEKMEHVQRLESLGILAGGIAHDFNNILTAIMGNAAMASRNMDDMSPAKEFLARIGTSTQRASDLCKQMLAYSGKGRFVIKPVNLSELVEEMTRLMEVSIEKSVVIKYHLAENLPPVEADAAQLQQVILNLITNANEAIESKSGVISFATGVMHADKAYLSQTITEAELPEGRYVFIEVSDTGCGMSQAVIKKIFDPFFTTKFTGRGLGMSAVLGIVRGHQGAMRVYSEVGNGTTFKVLLPVSAHALVAEDQGPVADSWKASGTILVVDDEETIREVATMMLEDMGFKTLRAGNGVEALHVYHQHENEIVGVLLDMTMPKMDGKECFRELRRINPDVKVILSSGYNEQDATSRFVGQGLAGFLQKPYMPEALREKLRSMFVDQN